MMALRGSPRSLQRGIWLADAGILRYNKYKKEVSVWMRLLIFMQMKVH